jgi:hypothetical protein
MKKINVYRVGILKSGEKYFETEQINIVAENKYFYCLETDLFTTIAKGKDYDSTHERIDRPHINKRENETGYFANHRRWGNGVFYILYTLGKKRPSTIRREISDFIQDKIGYLSSIDLSFIK